MSARREIETVCPTPGCGVTIAIDSLNSTTGYAVRERIQAPYPCSMCSDEIKLNRGHALPLRGERPLFRGVAALLDWADRWLCKVEHAYYRRIGGRLHCSQGHLIQDLAIESCHSKQGRNA